MTPAATGFQDGPLRPMFPCHVFTDSTSALKTGLRIPFLTSPEDASLRLWGGLGISQTFRFTPGKPVINTVCISLQARRHRTANRSFSPL